MKRNNSEQLYHYLLSFDEAVLIKWYNEIVVDAFGDFSEQIIRENNASAHNIIKDTYSLEALARILRNPKTELSEDTKYIAATGGDNGYIISFNSFKEFLDKEIGLLEYLLTYYDNVEELEKMAEESENASARRSKA